MTFSQFLLEFNCSTDRLVTKSEIDALERYLDQVWAKAGIDVDFTKHFIDRINDSRNIKQITVCDVQNIFDQAFKRYSDKFAKQKVDFQAVLKSVSTAINIPFILDSKDGQLTLINKTIMRKKDFKSDDRIFTVESANYQGYKMWGFIDKNGDLIEGTPNDNYHDDIAIEAFGCYTDEAVIKRKAIRFAQMTDAGWLISLETLALKNLKELDHFIEKHDDVYVDILKNGNLIKAFEDKWVNVLKLTQKPYRDKFLAESNYYRYNYDIDPGADPLSQRYARYKNLFQKGKEDPNKLPNIQVLQMARPIKDEQWARIFRKRFNVAQRKFKAANPKYYIKRENHLAGTADWNGKIYTEDNELVGSFYLNVYKVKETDKLIGYINSIAKWIPNSHKADWKNESPHKGLLTHVMKLWMEQIKDDVSVIMLDVGNLSYWAHFFNKYYPNVTVLDTD